MKSLVYKLRRRLAARFYAWADYLDLRPAVEIQCSPSGSDDLSETKKPFRTIQASLNVIEKISVKAPGPITINLHEGTYSQ